MSAPESDQKLAEIKAALFGGRKIEAIKLYRESLGGGLAEAKAAIDRLEAELRTTSPDKFTQPPVGTGAPVLLALVLAVVLAGLVAMLLFLR